MFSRATSIKLKRQWETAVGEGQVKMSCITLQALMLTGHASSHTDWLNSDDWLVITECATSRKEPI